MLNLIIFLFIIRFLLILLFYTFFPRKLLLFFLNYNRHYFLLNSLQIAILPLFECLNLYIISNFYLFLCPVAILTILLL